ncbi:MAG: preprotein translocase subunit SecA [Candidatus Omnitrophota bacterium]
MFNFILNKIVGTHNEREIKKLLPYVEKANSSENIVSQLSDEQLRQKTEEFKIRLNNNETIDDLLGEAFAVVREVGRRQVDMRHFDVQFMGGVVLHQGKIAEMATGEGKTLVATLSVYLNALPGKGVHVVTVNDYLAKRDCGWMGRVYYALGISCAAISHDTSVVYDPGYTDNTAWDKRMENLRPITRKDAYNCDVTYGTNNEFGFDYLRDNMAVRKQDMVQRELNYAIVDEVDSILIDEARTPLIISGPAEESTDKYYKIDKIIPKLIAGKRNEETKEETGDFIIDEKAKTAYLTEAGAEKAAKLLGLESLHSIESVEYKHHIDKALRAHTVLKRDVDYVVCDGQVMIVDEFTGRLMPGRRWSDGLHQAVEAKEMVKIERENQTLATVTFQNYFRMYKKLAGMTGTALTEEPEFRHIYKLEVLSISTNRPLIRTNFPDAIYKTEQEKFNAVIEEILQLYEKRRPVLVGTISIEKSELISRLLKQKGIPHKVLNAKYHEQEAVIVAQAGSLGSITIATNMAGRGTDILLGGSVEFFADELLRKKGIDPHLATAEQKQEVLERVKEEIGTEHNKVVELGGLHIIGTERHEARRIDNQLRGRAGRQGDPGSSRFYLSLQDDLMRLFGSDMIMRVMDKLGVEEGMNIQHPLITRSIETAQKRVESFHFDSRKHLLEYDNVLNKQREVIYAQRRMILEGEELKEYISGIIEDVLDKALDTYVPEKEHQVDWDLDGIRTFVRDKFGLHLAGLSENKDYIREDLKELILQELFDVYEKKENEIGTFVMRDIEKAIMLHIVDSQWKDHLYAMDGLREGIGLRAYGQRDPLVEYQHEGFRMFNEMIERIKESTAEFVFRVNAVEKEQKVSVFGNLPQQFIHAELGQFEKQPVKTKTPPAPETNIADLPPEQDNQTYIHEQPKVGRNEPCPCGSGKKFKKCCGK